jgi:hypothetical protein
VAGRSYINPAYAIDDIGCGKVPLSSAFGERVRDDTFLVFFNASMSWCEMAKDLLMLATAEKAR